MKKIIVMFIVLSFSLIQAQQNDNMNIFSTFEYGVLGGVNFESVSDAGGDIRLEFKTNLITDLKILFSAGYNKSIESFRYNVKRYRKVTVENEVHYRAEAYDMASKIYDIFPISLGLQYFLTRSNINPYLIADVRYNFIYAKAERTPRKVWSYNSFEEVPEEFRNEYSESFPDASSAVGLGMGATYSITERLNIDLRYVYNIDNKIINTHQLLFGIFL